MAKLDPYLKRDAYSLIVIHAEQMKSPSGMAQD